MAEETKKSRTLLESIKERRAQGKCPRDWRESGEPKESHISGLETREQNPLMEPAPRWEIWIGIDEVLELPCGQAQELKTSGNSLIRKPYNIVRLIFLTYDIVYRYNIVKSLTRFPVNIGEKCSPASNSRKGKNHFEVSQSALLFLTRRSLR